MTPKWFIEDANPDKIITQEERFMIAEAMRKATHQSALIDPWSSSGKELGFLVDGVIIRLRDRYPSWSEWDAKALFDEIVQRMRLDQIDMPLFAEDCSNAANPKMISTTEMF